MRVAYYNSVAEGLAASYPCFYIYQMVVCHIVESGIAPNNKYQKWIDFFYTEMANNMINDVTKIMNKLYEKYSSDKQKNMLEFFHSGLELELAFWDEMYYASLS
ncbi:MAG: hypothetical protein ACR5K6_00845 [Wolbachia sp.]